MRIVDRDHTGLDPLRQRVGGRGRSGEGVGGEAIGQPIGFRDRIVKRVERVDERDRAERLLVHRARACRHMRQHGRREVIALIATARAAAHELRALFDRVLDEGLQRGEAPRIGEGADIRCGIETAADLERLRPPRRSGREIVG